MDGTLTAFAGELWIATGDRGEIRAALQAMGDDAQNILLFDDRTGRQVDIDLEDSVSHAPRGRGRPKLGVQAREVTLLPRQWDWLAQQPGGVATAGGRRAQGGSRADVTARGDGRGLSFHDGDGGRPALL